MPLTVCVDPICFHVCSLWRAKPIAQDVVNFIAKHRAIWSGHRLHERAMMVLSLRCGNYGGDWRERQMVSAGISAWEWVHQMFDNQEEAVVALFSIHGLPHNFEKKA